ncbi:uncharacterized protein LOC135395204 [Ornithodoros turicata]|uniref:uncharacterized protein LOC135395204 n=1 Tax=Ornithodoros turicata TaxID=34597 RepID=UPI003139F8B4
MSEDDEGRCILKEQSVCKVSQQGWVARNSVEDIAEIQNYRCFAELTRRVTRGGVSTRTSSKPGKKTKTKKEGELTMMRTGHTQGGKKGKGKKGKETGSAGKKGKGE